MHRALIPGVVVAAFILGAASARGEGVALTFDDLPQLALTDSTTYAEVTTRRLLRGLHRHNITATGFVVGDKLEGQDRAARLALLNAWLAAGETLGNHTYDHDALDQTPTSDYIASIEENDAVLRPIVTQRHRRLVWFRHPYLEAGATDAIRRDIETWLATHGYRIAPVTMENGDWTFALPYDDAVLRGDDDEIRRIRSAYVDYTSRCVSWYRKAARQVLGRRPALIFLMHANRLNADSLDDIDDILKRNHLKPVSLDRAMRDPLYRLLEDQPGGSSDEWLSRWSELLHRPMPWASYPAVPADIEIANKRLDVDP